MATVIPNEFSASLADLNRMLIQLTLANRQEAIQREQLGLEERRIAASEQAGALDRLIAFAPFAPRDKTLAEMPQLHSTVRTAFPEFNPEDPGDLGGIVLNEETMETMLRPLMKTRFEQLPEEEKAKLLERGLNRSVLGVAATGTELDAQETRSGMFLQAWDKLQNDPVALNDILRTNMGLDPVIRVQYKGQEIPFNTSEAASLTVSLLQHQDMMGLRYAEMAQQERAMRMSRATELDLAGELMKQMQAHDITLGRPQAMQIVQAYNEASRLSAEGKLTDENNPLARFNAPDIPEEVRAAAQVFTGAARHGQDQMEAFLRQSEGGQQLLNFLDLGKRLSESGVPSERIPGLLDNITETFGGAVGTSPLPRYRQPGYFRGGNRVEITSPAPAAAPSVEALRSQMRTDADEFAAGRLNAAQLAQKYPDAAQRRAVIQAARLRQRK